MTQTQSNLKGETMRYAVRNKETQIDHVIFETQAEADAKAKEMTEYHHREYHVVEVDY